MTTTAKRIHLWEDGTWDELGGHWVACREEEWAIMLKIIRKAGKQRELTRKLKAWK